MIEWVVGLVLGAAALFLGKKFLDRGTSRGIEDKTKELAAKRRELEAKREDMSDLKYDARKKELEAQEKTLREKIKKNPKVEVPDEEVDSMDANELANRLNAYRE